MTQYKEQLDFYDAKAEKAKVIFENYTWLLGIAFGVLAVVVFAFSISFSSSLDETLKGLVLPILEVLFVLGSLYLLGRQANKRKTEFLKMRHLAEYFRINNLLAENGLSIEEKSLFGSKDFAIPEKFIAFPENLIAPKLDLPKVKESLISFIKNQQKYHKETRVEGYEHSEESLERRLKVILIAFLFVVIVKFVLELFEYTHVVHFSFMELVLSFCKFFVILLPPLYAAIEGVVFYSEWKRNIKISRELNLKYEEAAIEINQSMDDTELRLAAEKLELLFWKEQLDWVKWFHGKKIEPRV